MKNIILIFILFSLKVNAGITVIGNGGGFAEMQTIFFINHTNEIINLCIYSQICNLSDVEKNKWNNVKLNSTQFSQNQIIFEPNVNENWSLIDSKLTISQNWLYNGIQNFQRSDTEILAFVMSIQIYDIYKGLFSDLYLEVLNKLDGLMINHKNIKTVDSEFKFHWFEISNTNNYLKLFSIEDVKNAFNLNEVIESTMPKINLNSLNIYQVKIFQLDDQIVVFGLMSGKLDTTQFNSTPFKFVMKIGKDKIILKESIQFFLQVE